MHKYIEWKVNIWQILVIFSLAVTGWYRIGAVEKRQDTQEATFLRVDVNRETTARLEVQLNNLLREIESLRQDIKHAKE